MYSYSYIHIYIYIYVYIFIYICIYIFIYRTCICITYKCMVNIYTYMCGEYTLANCVAVHTYGSADVPYCVHKLLVLDATQISTVAHN